MKKALVLILFAFVSVAVSGDESPDVQIARLEHTITEQQRTIDRAGKMVDSLKQQLADEKKTTRRLLSLCRKHKIKVPKPSGSGAAENLGSPLALPLAVGQVVYFDTRQHFKVLQVIDGQNMLVEARIGREPIYNTSAVSRSRLMTTVPIRGYEFITRNIWIRGLTTAEFADKIIVRPPSFYTFKITGTRHYDTLFEDVETYYILEPYISGGKK